MQSSVRPSCPPCKETKKFKVVGLLTSTEYQKCKSYVQKWHDCNPDEVLKPDLRPMLSFDWEEFLTKMRRKVGGQGFWSLSKPVAVFLNDEFLGDEYDLWKYLHRQHLRFYINKDFHCVTQMELRDLINNSDSDYFYLQIAFKDHVIGTLIIKLYSDIVPGTCEQFMRLCLKKRNGYVGAPIHRIVKNCWIQVGGYNLRPKTMPCENYCISHDRRGILAMCNRTKHVDNSTQFLISLNPQPWMTYYYVAFGQVVHGNDVLTRIEKVPTDYEAPTVPITIMKAGKFTFDPEPKKEEKTLVTNYLKSKDPETNDHQDVLDPRCVPSIMSPDRFKRGLYYLPTDMKSNLPMRNLPRYCMKAGHVNDFKIESDDGEEAGYRSEVDLMNSQFYDELRSELMMYSDRTKDSGTISSSTSSSSLKDTFLSNDKVVK